MTKCFLYLRVSGKSQIRGDGWLRQFIACRQYAKEHNIQIVRIFREKGVSGTKELEDRPALSALFAALSENGIKTILIEKLDRLGRDLMVSETIVADIKKSGYMLLSTCEPDLISDDPSREFMRVIFTAIAQLEKKLLVLKLRGARQRMKARGTRCEGRIPYGEDKDRPEEHKVLAQMIALRKMGNNPEQIAKFLNAQGTPTRYGKSWLSQGVSRILARNKPESVAA